MRLALAKARKECREALLGKVFDRPELFSRVRGCDIPATRAAARYTCGLTAARNVCSVVVKAAISRRTLGQHAITPNAPN